MPIFTKVFGLTRNPKIKPWITTKGPFPFLVCVFVVTLDILLLPVSTTSYVAKKCKTRKNSKC
jgi:hypothetical protein